LVTAERKIRQHLVEAVPQPLKKAVNTAPTRHMLDVAVNGVLEHHKKYDDKLKANQHLLWICTEEADFIDSLWFEGEFVIPDMLSLLESQKKIKRLQFMPNKAMDMAEWIEYDLVPLIDQCTITNFSQAFQRYVYIMRCRELSYPRRELIHHFLSLHGRLVVRKKLRKVTGSKKFPRQDLFEHLEKWIAELDPYQFHGQAEPDLVDLMMYGCLNAVEDLDTGYGCIDRVDGLEEWYRQVMDEVGETSCLEQVLIGEKYTRARLIATNLVRNIGRAATGPAGANKKTSVNKPFGELKRGPMKSKI